MVTELVTFKLESDFLEDVDKIVKNSGFQNRTEFIRNALREKVEEVRLKQAMQSIINLKGAGKKKTSDEDLHRIREQVVKEFEKKFNR